MKRSGVALAAPIYLRRFDMAKTLVVAGEHLTLGQMLKEVGYIDTGGQAKWVLKEDRILVDGDLETRRGRKLYPGMRVTLVEIEESYDLVSARGSDGTEKP